jgi:hypothetical protein
MVYNSGMFPKQLDIRAAMRRLAERRIDEAMQEGKFDNLPLRGKEINLDELPACEDERLAWMRFLSRPSNGR